VGLGMGKEQDSSMQLAPCQQQQQVLTHKEKRSERGANTRLIAVLYSSGSCEAATTAGT
jgi:hypothetical protein